MEAKGSRVPAAHPHLKVPKVLSSPPGSKTDKKKKKKLEYVFMILLGWTHARRCQGGEIRETDGDTAHLLSRSQMLRSFDQHQRSLTS